MLEFAENEFLGGRMSGVKVIELNDLTEVSEGVFYSRYPLPLIDSRLIEFLKSAAGRSRLRRARFCAHLSPNAQQHDMLIVSHRDTYVSPHRHLRKSETLIVLEGAANVILFDDSGDIVKTVEIGTPDSGRPFFYRMPPRQFHSMAIESELLVFLENTTGPFNVDDCEHAGWAPGSGAMEDGKGFITAVLRKAHQAQTTGWSAPAL
jgi:cupin fold WbuC family metalloprotein